MVKQWCDNPFIQILNIAPTNDPTNFPTGHLTEIPIINATITPTSEPTQHKNNSNISVKTIIIPLFNMIKHAIILLVKIL